MCKAKLNCKNIIPGVFVLVLSEMFKLVNVFLSIESIYILKLRTVK